MTITLKEIKGFAENLYTCKEQCKNVLRDENYSPRGIFYLGRSFPKLIVLGKNPGGMLLNKGEAKASVYEEQVQWELKCFGEYEGANFRFHIRLLQYLEFILFSNFITYQEAKTNRKELTSKIFKIAYKTNLLKCSTPDEQENLRTLSKETSTCVPLYLRKELEICNNPPVLCLGDESYDEFKRHFPNYISSSASIRHPSYPIRADNLLNELEKVKSNLMGGR